MNIIAWETYLQKTKDSIPRPLLVKAVGLVSEKGKALDLGSGALNDVRYLVQADFNHVTAVDFEPIAKDIIVNFPAEKVEYIISTFENFDFRENLYDLINAQFSLPFNSADTFTQVWKNILFSLKPGGVITGQFFGVRDEWNGKRKNMNFHTIEAVKKFLADIEIIEFKEDEADRETAAGKMKHWHIFHFIGKK
jgi:SAM-dependent methyltransferase